MATRREVLGGAAGLAAMGGAAPAASAGPGADFAYDYLLVEVPRRRGESGGSAPFLAHLREVGLPAVRAVGGEVLGHVTPLIGWSSEQIAVIIRWSGRQRGRERAIAAITRHPSALGVDWSRLAPTLRPAPHDLPRVGGIYTHRWFEIREADFAEFVDLSGAAWPEFERDFEAEVFGLFRAQQSPAEVRRGVVRMLLNTWYASHAVWEASRTPSPRAAAAFRRRSDLTLTTRVVSLRFTPLFGQS